LKYRIYIDEVGNADLESSEYPNHRFLSLTGVVLDLEHVESTVHPQMEALKARYLNHHPDDPVIFHRSEMVNARNAFRPLIDNEIRRQFNRELLGLLSSWEYAVISVCIDKKRHKDTYQVWRHDPYHYCLQVLLERFVFFLSARGTHGDALAESRGGKEDRRLKDSFLRLWENGSMYLPPDKFQNILSSKQLIVKPKTNNIAGLQLADLLAHPSRNEILEEQGLLDRPIAAFAKQIINILQGKYYQREGHIYGKKFL
jgi:hypothetical protein